MADLACRDDLKQGAAMTKKIMFFTTGMTAGGAERVIATLANALDARGFDVVIAMIKGQESAYDLAPGVLLRSANLSPGLENVASAIGFYRGLIRVESPDVIASLSTKSDIIALVSKLLFHTRGKLIVSDRADPYTRNRRMQLACNFLYRWADALVCQSRSVADYYHRKCKRARVTVIPNPLNTDSITEPLRGARSPLVISVGRLSQQKNHRLAIGAFAQLRQSFPDLAMKIFGSGPLQQELAELITREGLEGVVTLEGVIPDVVRQNADAALFLFTSTHEGYPNALMEAAASGIPAVTTDFSPGTAREIIDDGINGYIVPSGNQQAVAEAAGKVLSGELQPDAVNEAAAGVRERHRTDRIVDAWLTVFDAA